jgi:hypothetical protein
VWGWIGGDKACIRIELRWENLLGDIHFVDQEEEDGIKIFILGM